MRSGIIIIYICLLLISFASGFWGGWTGRYSVLIVSVAVFVFSFYRILVLYNKTFKKVNFLLNAIKNGDYTFKFAENQGYYNDRFLNYALNDIKQILTDAKIRAIEKEKYYELILNSIKTGVVTINSSGNVYQSNNEGLRVLGLEVFTNIAQLSVISCELRDAFASIKAGEKRSVVVTDELGEKTISMVASEITVSGSPMTIIALSDINNELAEKELESWIRLIRVLTHEIMNSLAPVTSLSGSLIDICEDKQSNMAKGLTTINATSKGLISFVESYRKFTHIPVPNKKALALKGMLEQIISLAGDFPIDVSVTPEDILIYADGDLISQVIINIIKNGQQACAEKNDGHIWIDARLDEKENTIIDISNNGGAIPKDIADNIFMPFFTTKQSGSGIGLSLSKQIMRLHEGSLRLSCNTPERVTFTLLIA